VFLCSVWYVSHLSILLFYLLLFTARTVLCIVDRRDFSTFVTVTVAVVYEGKAMRASRKNK
jgi:hypothetical protein